MCKINFRPLDSLLGEVVWQKAFQSGCIVTFFKRGNFLKSTFREGNFLVGGERVKMEFLLK